MPLQSVANVQKSLLAMLHFLNRINLVSLKSYPYFARDRLHEPLTLLLYRRVLALEIKLTL